MQLIDAYIYECILDETLQSSIFGHWKQLFWSFQTIVFSIYMAIGKKFKRKIKPTHFFKMCYLVADVQHYQEYAIIGVSLTKCYSLETCWQGTWLSPIYRVPGAKITPHEWVYLSMRSFNSKMWKWSCISLKRNGFVKQSILYTNLVKVKVMDNKA